MNSCHLRQVALLLSLLLCKNMTFVSMLTLDFTSACNLESLLGAGFGFHFWHCLIILPPKVGGIKSYFFFGLIIMIILLPSSFGICSTNPTSSSSCANLKRRISPLSLNTIVLPLKNTYALTFAPSSRNF